MDRDCSTSSHSITLRSIRKRKGYFAAIRAGLDRDYEPMQKNVRLKSIAKLIFLFGGLISIVAYYADAYPMVLVNLGKSMGVASLVIIYVGCILCYLAPFIWRNMRPIISLVNSIAFLLFMNLFFLSVHSPYSPLGILFILAMAIAMLILEMREDKYRDRDVVD
jgi:hypothetical protein